MVQFSELAIPFILFLIGINTLFAAMGTIPASQMAGSEGLFAAQLADTNTSIYTYVDNINFDVNAMADQTDANVTTLSVATLDLGTIAFNFVDNLTGGGLGAVKKFLSFVTQMAFGYNVWLDFFFNPQWGPFFYILGSLFKGFFLIVQVYTVISIFFAILGRKV